jgi:hypothetical protein
LRIRLSCPGGNHVGFGFGISFGFGIGFGIGFGFGFVIFGIAFVPLRIRYPANAQAAISSISLCCCFRLRPSLSHSYSRRDSFNRWKS